MTKWVRSSAVTWAIGYVLLALAALVAFALPLYYAWNVTVRDGRIEVMRDDLARLTDVFDRTGVAGLRAWIDERVYMHIAGERMLLLTGPDGHVLSGNLDAWPRGLPARSGTDELSQRDGALPTARVFVHTALPGGYQLLVGRDIARYVPLEHRFVGGLVTAILLLALFGAVGALMIRRALLAKAEGIGQTVAAIMQGQLHHRLPVRRDGDELDTLSQTINGMLDHIEHLVDGIRGVSNSIAHDLRTPLAELRSRLESLSLVRPPAPETFAEIDAAVSDVDRVIGIFNALLRLAEIDAGSKRAGFVTFEIGAVAREIAEFYEPVAELKHITLRADLGGSATVQGDPLLVAQAYGNLVDNALKYAGAGGMVELTLRLDGTSAVLAVADNGPGMGPGEREQAVRRFYRGDAARTTPGVGLGLSIVEAVARLHGGSLVLSDNAPGLRAQMLLPIGSPTVALGGRVSGERAMLAAPGASPA